ncbi:MAG: hypothetical protein MI725_13485 [Pirellulales bacterium]|nr:hypothetical protein [Pirellulales bacterium]
MSVSNSARLRRQVRFLQPVTQHFSLPAGDSDYSTRWRLIKSNFTRLWSTAGGSEGELSDSRSRKQERGVWQRRFYEHTCRDENDVTAAKTISMSIL